MEVVVKVTKKRKMCDVDLEMSPTTVAHVRSNYSEDVSVEAAASFELCSTENTVLNKPPATCCASNGSSDVTNRSSKFVDLDDSAEVATKENNSKFDESRETILSSDLKVEFHKLETTPKPRHAKSRRRARAEKMPSEADFDEFFAAAEKDLLERSAEKYNFDFVKEKPLEGRYEWARL